MKTKFLFVVVLVAASGMLKAQSFGLHIGGNLSSAKFKGDASLFALAPESKFGFLAGVVAEVPVAKSLNFRPELNFIQKGYKVSFSEDFGTGPFSVEGKETLNYLELPLNFTYNLPAGTNTVFLGAGPSLALGLSGKYKLEQSFPGMPPETDEGRTNFGSDQVEDDYKVLDIGANINGGFQLSNGLFAKLGYTFGLRNISHDPDNSLKNKGFSFSVGYLFSRTSK